jgi:hypothetical protein
MVAGINAPLALVVSCVLGFRVDEDIPRFRDVFTDAEDCPVAEYDVLIYTRMGGGNYDHWMGCCEEEPCPYCRLLKFEEKLWYAGGYDDDFDCTYRTLVVKFTPEQKELWNRIKNEGLRIVDDKLKELFPKIWEKIHSENTDGTNTDESKEGEGK